MQGLRLGCGACSTGLFQHRHDGGHGVARVGCKNVVVGHPLRTRGLALQSDRGAFQQDSGSREKVNRVVLATSASSTLEQAAVEEKDEVFDATSLSIPLLVGAALYASSRF